MFQSISLFIILLSQPTSLNKIFYQDDFRVENITYSNFVTVWLSTILYSQICFFSCLPPTLRIKASVQFVSLFVIYGKVSGLVVAIEVQR